MKNIYPISLVLHFTLSASFVVEKEFNKYWSRGGKELKRKNIINAIMKEFKKIVVSNGWKITLRVGPLGKPTGKATL